MPIIEDISDLPEPIEFSGIQTLETSHNDLTKELDLDDKEEEYLLTEIQTKTTKPRTVVIEELPASPQEKTDRTNDIVQELRQRPAPDRFVELIVQLEKTPATATPEHLNVLATVLIINLPDLYSQLSHAQLAAVYRLFTSLSGIAHISTQIKTYLQQFLSEDEVQHTASGTSASAFLIDPAERGKLKQAEITAADIRPAGTTYTKITETLQTRHQQITLLLGVLSGVLAQRHAVASLYARAATDSSSTRRAVALKEINAYVAGSRVFELAAQCATVFGRHPLITGQEPQAWVWLADPAEYQRFLAFSLKAVLKQAATEIKVGADIRSDFLLKALRLHGSSPVSAAVHGNDFVKLLFDPHDRPAVDLLCTHILGPMRPPDLRSVFVSFVVPFLYKEYLCVPALLTQELAAASTDSADARFTKETVSACANFLIDMIRKTIESAPTRDRQREILEAVTAGFPDLAVSAQYALGLRRVLVLAMSALHAQYGDASTPWPHARVLELLTEWGTNLYIRHAPAAAQQAQTELLVLWVLQLARSKTPADARFVKEKILNSAPFLSAISNRLAANALRPRVLGMALAETFTALDKDGAAKLSFGMDEIYGEDMDYFRKYLVGLRDDLSTVEWPAKSEPTKPSAVVVAKPVAPIKIEEKEVESDSDDEFTPLSFVQEPDPDSDLEDEDLDDPSLTVLDKDKRGLKPPAYIKDLLVYITATDSFHKQKLGLETAAGLIRRKAQYGQELKFYGRDLATALVGLRDSFEMRGFGRMREDALAALVAADAAGVAPHLAVLLVTGDYSLAQRALVLGSIVAGAQALAQSSKIGVEFASKRLPSAALHERFMEMDREVLGGKGSDDAYSFAHLKAVTYEMQQELIGGAPARAQAQLVGAAQVLRVSGSLEKRRQGAPQRSSAPNVYSKIASRSFFMPLVAQWHRIAGSAAMTDAQGMYYGLFLAQFLRALGVLLYLAAPAAPQLAEMCGALVEIVMEQRARGLRGSSTGDGEKTAALYEDLGVREGLYTAVLAVVQVANEQDGGETLVTRWPQQTVELKLWVEEMWARHEQHAAPEGAGGGATVDEEGRRVRGLAANVLFLLEEIVSKWQRRLVGELLSVEHGGGSETLRVEKSGVAGGNVRIR